MGTKLRKQGCHCAGLLLWGPEEGEGGGLSPWMSSLEDGEDPGSPFVCMEKSSYRN